MTNFLTVNILRKICLLANVNITVISFETVCGCLDTSPNVLSGRGKQVFQFSSFQEVPSLSGVSQWGVWGRGYLHTDLPKSRQRESIVLCIVFSYQTGLGKGSQVFCLCGLSLHQWLLNFFQQGFFLIEIIHKPNLRVFVGQKQLNKEFKFR